MVGVRLVLEYLNILSVQGPETHPQTAHKVYGHDPNWIIDFDLGNKTYSQYRNHSSH